MDEMLSMALWIMVVFMTLSFAVTWFNSQPGIGSFNLGLNDNNTSTINTKDFSDTNCASLAATDIPAYAYCSSIGQIATPVYKLVDGIWNLLTNWQNILKGIFGYNSTTGTYTVPGGDLFVGLILPFLSIIEIGAVIVILMRLAAIIRGVAGGFL